MTSSASGKARDHLLAICMAWSSMAGAPLLGAVQQSAMVKLLESGKVPAERQGTLIALIGRQGSPEDLGVLLRRATVPGGFDEDNRGLALRALSDAASTRSVFPEGDRSAIAALIDGDDAPSDPEFRSSAIRLAGVWKVEQLRPTLVALASDETTDATLRDASLKAIAEIGGEESRIAIASLAEPDRPAELRMRAVAALATLDIDAAAPLAVDALSDGAGRPAAIEPLLDAFLERQIGPDRLAAAIRDADLTVDSAKLALRYLYSIGRTDPGLVSALSAAAGINAEPEPLTPDAMAALLDDLGAHGDPGRGEDIFRRPDVNCMKCHAVAKAGGNIGPDLSAIGASSPPDYLIRSILDPAEAVKEEFQVKTVLTLDGQIFQGIVEEESRDRIVLREADGDERIIPAADVEDEKTGGSLMPAGLTTFMTRGEFIDLVAFLSVLGKPGDYAIRTTPTMQRWRVLPLADADQGVDPDDAGGEALPAAISSAPPRSWLPAYARVSGDLPIGPILESIDADSLAIRGEIDVTRAGPIRIEIGAPDGASAWIDDTPADPAEPNVVDLGTGRHALTLRLGPGSEGAAGDVRVEVTRVEDSAAEFTVVGGP